MSLEEIIVNHAESGYPAHKLIYKLQSNQQLGKRQAATRSKMLTDKFFAIKVKQ